jgi:hypothetical protein
MLLVLAASRLKTVFVIVLILLVQFASAGVPEKSNSKHKFIADLINTGTTMWPAWLQACDSLNRILSGPLTGENVSYRWQPAYAGWLQQAREEAVADFVRGYFFIDANPIYPTRDPNIRVYQAYESITFTDGFVTAVGDEFIAEIVPLGSQVPAPSNNTGSANSDMNWVLAKSFDENGNVTGESKQFFDNSGRLLQSQTKTKYRKDPTTAYTHVFASQPVRDALGRDAMATMSAPIDNSEFIYKPDFVRNGSGGAYDYKNFDRYKLNNNETDKTNNPDAVGGQNVPGTLGWYYGSNNTWEPYTPTTQHPYSRLTYYRDGTGNTKKSAGVGEEFKMGSGHELSSYITPVISELDHYLQVRNKYFSVAEMGATPVTLQHEAIQSVSMDANGRMGITILDKGGKILLAARPGTDMQITNSVTLSAVEDNLKNSKLYFRIFNDNSAVSITGDYTLSDMNTELPVSLINGSQLNKGYYKAQANSGTVTVNYANGYTDVSYYFYNQLGQLKASIASEGVKKLINGATYSAIGNVPFVSLNEYDDQGRLVKSTTTDGGTRENVYRTDGKVRFSQNAEQKLAGSFSYTNYDQYGRPFESGEYKPGTGGIPFNSDLTAASPMRNILEDISVTGGLINGTRKDVSMTLYDVVDNSHNLGSPYLQDKEYLGGTVTMTQKYSSIVNNTPNSADLVSSNWYNYNEDGKMVWSVQYIKGLGYKTTDYTYDVQGRLVKKDYQKGPTNTDRFIHYYDYDKVTQKLVRYLPASMI